MRVSKLLRAAVAATGLLLSSVLGVLYWRDTITPISTDELSGKINDLTVPLELDKESIQRIDFVHAEPREILALPKKVLEELSDGQVQQAIEVLCNKFHLDSFQGQPRDDEDRERHQKLKYLIEQHLGYLHRSHL